MGFLERIEQYGVTKISLEARLNSENIVVSFPGWYLINESFIVPICKINLDYL